MQQFSILTVSFCRISTVTGGEFHDQRALAATLHRGHHLLCHRCGASWWHWQCWRRFLFRWRFNPWDAIVGSIVERFNHCGGLGRRYLYQDSRASFAGKKLQLPSGKRTLQVDNKTQAFAISFAQLARAHTTIFLECIGFMGLLWIAGLPVRGKTRSNQGFGQQTQRCCEPVVQATAEAKNLANLYIETARFGLLN